VLVLACVLVLVDLFRTIEADAWHGILCAV